MPLYLRAGAKGLVAWDWQPHPGDACRPETERPGDLAPGGPWPCLSSPHNLGLRSDLQMWWAQGRAGFLWAGGLQPEPWHLAEWPLRLGHGHGAVGLPL